MLNLFKIPKYFIFLNFEMATHNFLPRLYSHHLEKALLSHVDDKNIFKNIFLILTTIQMFTTVTSYISKI